MRSAELHPHEVAILCVGKLRSLLTDATGPVEAVYFWGSIVRPDFDPERSDIDSVVLGESLDLEETCRWLSSAIPEGEPKLWQFKARPLYLEDLNGGRPRSELAQLIHPKILLADFKNWQLVLGRKFALEDFRLAPAALDEILALRLSALRRRLSVHRDDSEREPAKYVLKEVSFICHTLHQLRVGPHPFSYQALITHADSETREAVEVLSSLQEIEWEEEACRRALGVAEPFLERTG